MLGDSPHPRPCRLSSKSRGRLGLKHHPHQDSAQRLPPIMTSQVLGKLKAFLLSVLIPLQTSSIILEPLIPFPPFEYWTVNPSRVSFTPDRQTNVATGLELKIAQRPHKSSYNLHHSLPFPLRRYWTMFCHTSVRIPLPHTRQDPPPAVQLGMYWSKEDAYLLSSM